MHSKLDQIYWMHTLRVRERGYNAATRAPAQVLGIYGKRGSLQVGADADFVVLEVPDEKPENFRIDLFSSGVT